jgi:hypothetical protein
MEGGLTHIAPPPCHGVLSGALFMALLKLQLTLSVPAEYMYSAASHASCPDGALVIRDFYKVVKWPGMVDFNP